MHIKSALAEAIVFPWKRDFILIIDEDKTRKEDENSTIRSVKKITDFVRSNGQHRFGGYALINDVLYCTGGMVDLYGGCHDLVHCQNLLEPKRMDVF